MMFIITWIKTAISTCWQWTKSCFAWFISPFIDVEIDDDEDEDYDDGMEYPEDTECIKESRLASGRVIYTYHTYSPWCDWWNGTIGLDPKGEKEEYSTLAAIKIAIEQKKNLEAENKVVSEKIVEML